MEKSLGDRMKEYEAVPDIRLIRRMPVIGRLDGRAFHSVTASLEKPFDTWFKNVMNRIAVSLVKEIQGCKLAYIQSDEISLLLTDYDNLNTDCWFGYRVQKMCSVAASIASVVCSTKLQKPVEFDARFFNLPKEEVCNYFIWRQQDCTRNSISSLAQSKFSHNELWGKNCDEMQEMLMVKHNINWSAQHSEFKRGSCVVRVGRVIDGPCIDIEIPVFTADRSYVEKWL